MGLFTVSDAGRAIWVARYRRYPLLISGALRASWAGKFVLIGLKAGKSVGFGHFSPIRRFVAPGRVRRLFAVYSVREQSLTGPVWSSVCLRGARGALDEVEGQSEGGASPPGFATSLPDPVALLMSACSPGTNFPLCIHTPLPRMRIEGRQY